MKLSFTAFAFALVLATSFPRFISAGDDLRRVSLRGGSYGKDKPNDDFEIFKQDHLLLDDAILSRQRVSAAGTFKANGKKYSVRDLQPFNIFSPNATFMEDGVPKPLESDSRRSRLFMSKGEDGETILVIKEGALDDADDDDDGVIKSIDILNRDGSEVYMESLADGTLATIREEDRDRQKVKEFSMGGIGGEDDEFVLVEEDFRGHHRELQQSCSSYKVIDVAIAYDSSFCSMVAGGSSSQARTVVEQTVARASLLYERICVRVKLSHLEGYCSAAQDPYVQAVSYNNIGCSGSYGVLQAFRDYWNSNRRNINRDAAHFFYGSNFPGSTIGCASRPALCNSEAYGACEMSFTSDSQLRANLFAHELGHNAGASHVNDNSNSGNFLMEASINSASSGFTSQSTNSIQSYLNSKSCIANENGGGGGGNNDGGDGDDGSGNGDGDNDDSEGKSFRLESSQHRGYCISAQGEAANGTPVNLEPCDDSSGSQSWFWNEQTHLISSSMGNSKCLLPAGNARRGARLVLWDCDPRFSYAAWSYYTDNSLRPDYDTWQCVDVRNSDRTTLQMWQCNGSKDKKWLVRG